MPFNLFRKKKQPVLGKPADLPREEPNQEASAPTKEKAKPELIVPTQQPEQVTDAPVPSEQHKQEAATETPIKTYLKAMPLRELSDVENVKNEIEKGNIIILKVTPLASKSIADVKTAVNDLYKFAEMVGGDIARLGEERVVICPKSIKIWREKTPAPIATNQPLPTTAA
jgi:SepF-like predicted cell division protein (DUF552 family)